MKNRSIKYTILLLSLILINNYVEARKIPGFIITENKDTIYGEVIVSFFNLHTVAVILDGVNLEPLHYEVWFREYEKRRFHNFQAKDISAFGFYFRYKNYLFHSFTLESNSIIEKESKRDRFLQLCYVGKVSLYKDLSRMNMHNINVIIPSIVDYTNSIVYYNYFLFDDIEGLTKVEISENIKTISDLLNLYNIEKEFIDLIPKKTKLKDINIVLKKYEFWLYEIESNKIMI
ncbi:MAG: hypothetical protein GQ564_10835 [Bacteroidales bacterium]|nr:hypothetical protein [Bacteroidales bacterium]